jgi:putative ABC transport system permease protein
VSNTVAQRRTKARHTSMFIRMLVRAAVLRRGRAAAGLIAMIVAAAVTTAMLTLYVDVQTKLRKEFRNYGANAIVVAKDGQSLPTDALSVITSALGGRGLAVPFAYVVARSGKGQSIVVAGTDFDTVRQLDKWWSVTSWPQAPRDALLGVRAADVVGAKNGQFDLSFQGRVAHLNAAGTLQTGASEDSRVYMPLDDFEAWTQVPVSAVEVAASGSPEEVNGNLQRIGQALPMAEVRPIRQVMEGEARVLGKTRMTLLAASALIILTAALCVLSTLIGWVSDRRRDFAVMKALGASQGLLNGFFAAEAAALGAVGAVAGFVLGVGTAVWIGQANFHAPVTPRLSVFPTILVGSIVVALISALIPISLLRRVQPAMILRGE